MMHVSEPISLHMTILAASGAAQLKQDLDYFISDYMTYVLSPSLVYHMVEVFINFDVLGGC